MKPFYLSEITTKDGLIHQGIFFKPTKPGRRAVLWVHGLTGKFYGDTAIMNEFADMCENVSCGFASFNNRGHDQVAGVTIVDKKLPGSHSYGECGAGFEEFEKCIEDIHAAVEFLVSNGFSEVVLAGHSTGATKVCYSEGIKPHKNVIGAVLTGPLSDRLSPGIDRKNITGDIRRMEKKILNGKGNELITGLGFFPMTLKRFLSLYKKGSSEDVFDYDDPDNGLKIFSTITKPLFVIISELDEYLDRPANEVMNVFNAKTKSKKYQSLIFSGANHGFEGKETELAENIISWAKTI